MLEQVKASAGSGKTYTLTRAFLGFLAQAREEAAPACRLDAACATGYGWTDILAATFTNKAAAEMKERVLKSLKKIALRIPDDDPLPGWNAATAAAWISTLIRRLGSLNIRTLDSLLHLLLQQSALGLGLPPDFDAVFDLDAFFEPLYDALVARAAAQDGAERQAINAAGDALLQRSGSLGFLPRATLKRQLGKTLAFRLVTQGQFCTDPRALQRQLDNLDAALRATLPGLDSSLESAKLTADKRFLGFLDKLRSYPKGNLPLDSVYCSKPSLADCLLKKSQPQLTDAAESAYSTLKDACTALATRGRTLRNASDLLPFLDLADLLHDDLEACQQRRGQVLSLRWPAYAATLFDDPTAASEASCRLGSRLGHVLIDEFQDTSRPQWEAIEPLVLEALSRNGTLFYVGDVKQAIYGWRGGEAALFDEIAQRPAIRAIAGAAVAQTLEHNWRSGRHIVEFNNAWLGQLVAQAEDVARAMLSNAPEFHVQELAQSIRTAYSDGQQSMPKARDAAHGYVRVQTLKAQSADELDVLVRDALHTLLCDDVLTRRPCRDVAILVRSNEQAARVSQWCIEWNLPVITENSLLLAEHPLIRQTVSFLAFLDYARDDLAFWEFVSGQALFGPVSGLNVATLHDWLDCRRPGPLYRHFQEDFPEVWERWIEPFFRRTGLMTPYDLVSAVFARYGTAARAPQDALFIRRFLETVHAAESAGALALSTFIEFWRQAAAEEKVPFPENVDAIRVMTIHKAKGLQFPVTIVPFHHFSAGVSDSLAAVPAADFLGADSAAGGGRLLLTTLSKDLGAYYYQRLVPQLLEQLDMLYVAWTRPVDELYAFITEPGAQAANRSPLLAALRVLLAPWLGEKKENAETEKGSDRVDAAFAFGAPPQAAAVPPPAPDATASLDALFGPRTPALESSEDDHFEPLAWAPRLKIFRSTFETATFAERRRGTLAHRCLEQLRATDDAAADVERALQAGLRGVSNPHDPAGFAQELDGLEPELRGSLTWLRELPEFSELLRHGLPEQEILDAEGRMHRVDMLVELPERVVVVEYKTGAPHPEHQNQVRRYLGLLSAMDATRGKTLEGLLVYVQERRCARVGEEKRQ